MKKILIIFVLILISCSDTQEGSTEIIKSIESSTTIPSTTTSTTLTTTTTSTLPDVMPTVLITCEPAESLTMLEGFMRFNFEITTGTNELVVLNIVTWFDSSRTDDLFIYDGLPSPGSSNEFGIDVDDSFSQYEIEIVVMDSKDNFANDYCLWGSPEPISLPDVPDNPGDSKNCEDFADYAEAKAWFDTYYEYYGDVANLDSDDDLEPCESLPGGP